MIRAPRRAFRMLSLLGILALTGCTDTADTFPLNAAAKQLGPVKASFVRTGIGRGPVTITMGDGEILTGEWRVASSGGAAFAFSGGQSTTAMAVGSGNVQFVARGPKTEMLCRGDASAFGHGSGQCQTYNGALWAISW